jgi:hypothetical protein
MVAAGVGRRAAEKLDALEEAAAADRTGDTGRRRELMDPGLGGVRGLACGGFREWRRRVQSVATRREEFGAPAVGEEAVVADAHEAPREDVKEEATCELVEREGEGAGSTAAVVLVAEGDGVVVHMQEPMVGDRDPVRVAGEVGEHGARPVEGRLGVDDPLGGASAPEVAAERRGASQGGEVAEEQEASVVVGLVELGEELASEEAAEHAHGEEEPRWATTPGGSVLREPTRRDHAVDVGVVDEGLAPGVEDGEEAQAGAEVSRVLGNVLERSGHGAEQEAVDHTRVLQREGREELG